MRTTSVSALIASMIVYVSLGLHEVQAGVASNCFYTNQLLFVYQLYDYSGNYSNVREYELRANASCDFIVDVDSKITWWSEGQIQSEVQIYHELPGNEYGC